MFLNFFQCCYYSINKLMYYQDFNDYTKQFFKTNGGSRRAACNC